MAINPVKVAVEILAVQEGQYVVEVVAGTTWRDVVADDGDRKLAKLQVAVGSVGDPLPHLCERTELTTTGELLNHTQIALDFLNNKDIMDDI